MTPDDAFACVMREVTRKEYVVLDADRDAGFVRAEKPLPERGWAALTSERVFDALTVTITLDGIRAVGSSLMEDGGERKSIGTTDTVRADAASIVDACK